MKQFFVILFTVGFFISYGQPHAPANPNTNQKTTNILNYLYSLKGTNGGILSGQQSLYWDWASNRTIARQDNFIYGATQEYPAVYSTDFGDFHYKDGSDVCEKRKDVVNAVINYAQRGALISLSYHMSPPEKEVCPYDITEKKLNKYSGNSYPHFDEIFETNGNYYDEMRARLKDVADELEILKDAGITVLWRPYHEMNNKTFWWAGLEENPQIYKDLWNQMYEYFTVERGLNNLLWVWSVNYYEAHYGKPQAYYPEGQVDIVGLDAYVVDQPHSYDKFIHDELTVIGNGRPLAITENGQMPDAQEIKENQPNYVFWSTWNYHYNINGNDDAFYKKNYQYDRTVNLDDFKAVNLNDFNNNGGGNNIKIEAEDGTFPAQLLKSSNDASGNEYVGEFSTGGDYVEVSANIESAGSYELKIGYRAPYSDQQNDIFIQGDLVKKFTFTKSDGFEVATIGSYDFEAGENTIRFSKNWGWMHVDYFEIVGASKGDDEQPPIDTNTSVKIEAEDGEFPPQLLKLSNDASENEYVGEFSTNGDYVEVAANIQNAGSYELKIGYRAPYSDQQNDIFIQGNHVKKFTFTKSDGFEVATIGTYNFDAGINTIRFSKNWGWMHVDYFEIVGASSGGDIVQPPIDNSGYEITINAKGACGGEKIEVLVNGTVEKAFTLTSAETAYAVNFQGSSIDHVQIAFINDGSSNTCADRNLFVNNIEINGTVFETEDSAVRDGCGNEEWLWCGGSFTFGSLNLKLAGVSEQGTLTLFPNPLSTNSLKVTFSGLKVATEIQVSIYSIDGAEMYTKSVFSNGLVQLADLPVLDSGIYMVRAVANGMQQNAKLNVQ